MSGYERAQEVEREETRRRDAAAQQVNERKELRSIARGHRLDKQRVMRVALDLILDQADEYFNDQQLDAAATLRHIAGQIPRFVCECGHSYAMHRAHKIVCDGPLSRSVRTPK